MIINRENYEVYFMDYIGGTLDESMMNDFIDFVEQNPDLKKELSACSKIKLSPEKVIFQKKENLYKNRYELENEFNNAAIAAVEGDLPENIKSEFENYLSSHPEKIRDLNLFRITKLQPDETVLFNKKSKLYKENKSRLILMWSVSIAAVTILTFFTLRIFNDTFITPAPVHPVAKYENRVIQPQNNLAEKTEKIFENKPNGIKVSHIKLKNSKSEKITDFKNDDSTLRMVSIRDTFKILNKMEKASININTSSENIKLVSINTSKISTGNHTDEEKLLADVIKEKTGIKNLSFSQIARSGLSLVSSLSKEKFTYKTDTSGNITHLNLDSRILAFSIPTKAAE